MIPIICTYHIVHDNIIFYHIIHSDGTIEYISIKNISPELQHYYLYLQIIEDYIETNAINIFNPTQ